MAIQKIEIKLLRENPLNEARIMSDDEIQNLKESIMEVGLLHPLVVYSNNDAEGTYTIVSGHKRYRAILEIAGPTGQALCSVIDKPDDQIVESELMTRANVHRSTPEEITTEVRIANNIWNTMTTERRKYWTERFENAFVEANKDNPKYIDDPEGFKSSRFRPRLDYIAQITGLGVSNRTLTKYLKETLKQSNEGLEEKPKKEKKITVRNIRHACESLKGIIDACEYTAPKPPYLDDLQDNLESVLRELDGKVTL